MLKVRWKIGKKPRGNYRTPFEIDISFVESEELKLRPQFSFRQEYPLPGKILLGGDSRTIYRDGNRCREIQKITVVIEPSYLKNPHISSKKLLGTNVCPYICESCRAYLEWRPGTPPDYSDFKKVFYQIATDLQKAWQEAVVEASSSGELEEEEIVITSFNTASEIQEKEKKLSRKVRVQ